MSEISRSETTKYSLWIVPRGEALDTTQGIVDQLSTAHHAPNFTPHLTVVANIFADDKELGEVKAKIAALAKQMGKFSITLSNYGYTDEEFRCLYLEAASDQLARLYQEAADVFPQVNDEHFAALPHMSVLYGHFSAEAKQAMIDDLPKEPVTVDVDSLDLYLTNSNDATTWRVEESFELR